MIRMNSTQNWFKRRTDTDMSMKILGLKESLDLARATYDIWRSAQLLKMF